MRLTHNEDIFNQIFISCFWLFLPLCEALSLQTVSLPVNISFYINDIDHVTSLCHRFGVGSDEFCCVFLCFLPAHVDYLQGAETPAAAAKLSS